jgi:hypothetical protein
MARVSQSTQPRPQPIWKGPLVAGLCFGVAYGITQRLVSFNVAELIRFGPGFDVQVFPGTSLESLKLRFGDAQAEIRGDLELQELERQQQEEAKQRAEEAKKAEERLKNAAQLEPLQDAEAGPAPEPVAAPITAPAPTPAAVPAPKPQPKPKPLAKPKLQDKPPASAPPLAVPQPQPQPQPLPLPLPPPAP